MKTSTIYLPQRLSCQPNQSGNHPIIKILTALPKGQDNAFYIDLFDSQGKAVALCTDHPDPNNSTNHDEMRIGDPIQFDVSDGPFHKAVIWNNRRFRQRGNLFDDYAKEMTGGYTGYDFFKKS